MGTISAVSTAVVLSYVYSETIDETQARQLDSARPYVHQSVTNEVQAAPAAAAAATWVV